MNKKDSCKTMYFLLKESGTKSEANNILFHTGNDERFITEINEK